MAKTNDHDMHKALKKNVLDDVTYTKKEVRIAWAKLILGLWGVFFFFLVILFLLSRHIIPC